MNIIKILFTLKSIFKKTLDYRAEQTKIFRNNNFDYIKSEEITKKIITELKMENYSMGSEHLKIFSAISLKREILNILEIGTFDGYFSVFLSKLFPKSEIDTLDLKDNSEKFKEIYSRENFENNKKYFQTRKQNLSKSKNISFQQRGSVSLINENFKKYDLIWIDGYHGAPTVIIDIVNAIRISKDNALILIDDVYLYGDPYSPYQSDATIKTLKELENNKIIKYNLFYKRIGKKVNKNEYSQKFIALIEKC